MGIRGINRFELDLERWAERLGTDAGKLLRRSGIRLYSNITAMNQVQTGYSRGSWNLSVGSIDFRTAIPQGTTPGQGEGFAAANNNKQIAVFSQETVRPGDSVFIANSVPYIFDLENGSSLQAPQGMVRTSIAAERAALIQEFAGL